jgi:L-ascorbate metabolism protein UlaG (beta-lactamase superfamily)
MPFKQHISFARRFMRGAIAARRREALTPMLPAPLRPDPARWPEDRLTAAWLGHATVLLNVCGVTILTDPVLEHRIGIGRGRVKLGPRRLIEPALRADELPRPDLVLLSHSHMDHTDLGTLARLERGVPVVVHRANRDLVRRFRNVTELDWGASTNVAGVRVEATPARHWGARVLTDAHRGYGGFLVQSGGATVLFAGDTAHTDQLTPLGRRHRIDLAILPIGAYDPWIANHASPEEAWSMFQALGADWLLPIHHSTFRLSREPTAEPLERLLAAAGSEAWRVVGREVGATWTLDNECYNT